MTGPSDIFSIDTLSSKFINTNKRLMSFQSMESKSILQRTTIHNMVRHTLVVSYVCFEKCNNWRNLYQESIWIDRGWCTVNSRSTPWTLEDLREHNHKFISTSGNGLVRTPAYPDVFLFDSVFCHINLDSWGSTIGFWSYVIVLKTSQYQYKALYAPNAIYLVKEPVGIPKFPNLFLLKGKFYK